MAIAFQPNAFQNNAFQTEEYPPITAPGDPAVATNVIGLTIGGVAWGYHKGTLDITERINARNTLSFEVFSLTGLSRPAVGAEIILTLNAVRIFGGLVEDIEETTIGESIGPGLSYNVTATDFNAIADNRVINGVFPEQTLKASLLLIEPFLHGVFLDGAQVDGPVLPLTPITFQSITDILNLFCAMAAPLYSPPQAVSWEIDYNRTLRAFGALESGHAAPFNVPGTPTKIIGSISVRPSKTDYANFVWLMYGSGQKAVIDSVATGDGLTTVFTLHHGMVSNEGYVNVGGTVVGEAITGGVNETLGTPGSGAVWTWDTATNTITRTPAPLGAIIVPYTALYPSVITSGIGALPDTLVERVYNEPDIFDAAVAQAVADALLQKHTLTFREITYVTAFSGCHPGQVQTITLPQHNVSGVHLITQVRIHDRVETELWYEITAVAGSTAVPESWMATYEQWGKSGAGSGSGVGGVGIVTTTIVRQPFFLGGSEALYRQSSIPDWVAADAVRVTIDTALRGAVLGTAYVRLRAVSGTVTARLRNITDGTTAGTSATVSSDLWTDANFSVTLATGVKVYELQVLPSIANTDVAAVGTFV